MQTQNKVQPQWTVHDQRQQKLEMIMLTVHHGECKAGAKLPALHIVGDSVSARELLKIRRCLHVTTSTNLQHKKHGDIVLRHQKCIGDNHKQPQTPTYMPTLRSALRATTTPTQSNYSYDRHEQVNNVTAEFSAALARAYVVASEPAMMMKVRLQLPRDYAIESLDPSYNGQDSGDFFFKFTEFQDTSFSELFPVGDNNFAEKYKGEDCNNMFFRAQENFTSGISADIDCLENFQDFSCLPWTENDLVHCRLNASSTMPCDAFLESSNKKGTQKSSGKLESSSAFDSNVCCDSLSNRYETQARLMPAHKKARTI